MDIEESIQETICYGSIGTPIIAVESGYVEALGWNQYGGWRVGIRSFDGKRYYYYAHLRKDHPYAKDLCEGQIVRAGDVIGYLGMTGYSSHENVNNINIPHLHFGVQLIFNEVQKDGNNQIWVDVYEIIEYLKKNSSQVYMAYPDTRDYERKFDMMQNEQNFYMIIWSGQRESNSRNQVGSMIFQPLNYTRIYQYYKVNE